MNESTGTKLDNTAAAQIQTIPVDRLFAHPDNPRLRLRDDVVAQIAAEITRSGFGPEHALLVRPIDGGYQIVSGHHRIEAAKRADVAEVPCWVREMDDDEAFMRLVLSNTQGELRRIEYAVHVYRSGVGRARAGRGKRGGLAEYARKVDRPQPRVSEQYAVGQVVEIYRTSDRFPELIDGDPYSQLLEISKADSVLWPLLVDTALRTEWSAADAALHVKTVREFEIPERWLEWLPLWDVVYRYLATREFSPSTVARLVSAADQVVEWIDAHATDPERAHAEFRAWLPGQVEPRAVGGYLQRLIASQYVVEGWHHGDWRTHVDKLDEGVVTLLLTDPPYGMAYQSDYRLDRRKTRKHQRIAADDVDAPAELLEMLDAFRVKLATDAHVLVFCGWANEPDMRDVIEKAGYTLRGSLVWDKQATGMGDPTTTFAPAHERILHAVKGSPPLYSRAADLLRHARCDSTRHPTEKPEPLLRELIEATTVEGQVVADPFGGVGSTPAAAKASGRRWFGCELDEKYWKLGEERLLS